jgi:hypothetical protein
MEGGVVTVCASPESYRPVSVGACESGVDHEFLEPFSENTLESPHRGVVSLPGREKTFWDV